ncbi:alpha/beta hydrolase [Streptomyces sp. 71268]|uniref:alpha/beta fold hydrolase n=1 Tax=Streptomyces sp. 71268 TaxID=3002640 RepID=UPI0023F85FD5|nr:alpha/beta hydrolase [Streptomyces sp. 71268]WEV24524.1 alpha/beta hydrolase [Streptomyces sp. 71268]
MPNFASYDGVTLHYSVLGDGPPLVCLPGGPGGDGRGLGDLGGLARGRTLLRLDGRAGGRSAVPPDGAHCGFAAQARDVLALADAFGLDRVDVVAHSAGTLTAQEFALRHPARTGRLVLVTPAGRLAREPDESELSAIRAESGQRADAAAAVAAGAAPGAYGTWSAAARAHHAAGADYGTPPPWLRSRFYADVTDEPTRVARLGALRAPVLAVAGSRDGIAGTAPARLLAACCPAARLALLPGCGHWPWVDDPAAFHAVVSAFLTAPATA